MLISYCCKEEIYKHRDMHKSHLLSLSLSRDLVSATNAQSEDLIRTCKERVNCSDTFYIYTTTFTREEK